MGTFSITHWLILLVVVVILFGTKKLRNMGSDLGSAVKGFKDAVKDEDTEQANKHRVLHHDRHDTPKDTVEDVQVTEVPIKDKPNQ